MKLGICLLFLVGCSTTPERVASAFSISAWTTTGEDGSFRRVSSAGSLGTGANVTSDDVYGFGVTFDFARLFPTPIKIENPEYLAPPTEVPATVDPPKEPGFKWGPVTISTAAITAIATALGSLMLYRRKKAKDV